MRLPNTAHTSRPWRIHAIAPDFRVEDVWAIRAAGATADDFPVALSLMATTDFEGRGNPVVVALFKARWKLGEIFGWDDESKPRATLLDRVPADLRQGPRGPVITHFTPLYLTHDEYAAEIVNGTVHGILHLGWVQKSDGTYGPQMAVLVKPNGRLGELYMQFIKPFRYAVVYPALTRTIEKRWEARVRQPR